MSRLRFKHVFAALMVLAGLSVFAFPARVTEGVKRPVQFAFAPVSWPVTMLAHWATSPKGGRDGVPAGDQPHEKADLVRENRDLRVALANVSAQLDRLREREAERERIGPVRQFCTPASVAGADAGVREAISVNLGTIGGARAGQPVLYWGGIVGKVDQASVGNARVRLVTETGFKPFTGRFARFQKNAAGETELVNIATDPVLVRGIGQGRLLVRDFPARTQEQAQIRVNDWLVLADTTDWPMALQGYRVGRVTKVEPRRDVPGYVEVTLAPEGNLLTLREVMVMTK